MGERERPAAGVDAAAGGVLADAADRLVAGNDNRFHAEIAAAVVYGAALGRRSGYQTAGERKVLQC